MDKGANRSPRYGSASPGVPRNAVKVGIIGLGHVSRFHIAALEESEQLVAAAVCDRVAAKRRAFPHLPFFISPTELLQASGVDAIIIATPCSSQYQLARQAILAGKHVLLEKPATGSPHQLAQLQSLARSRRRTLVVALHAAFGLETVWASANMCELTRRLGPILGFDCRFNDSYATDGRIRPDASALGGSWIDSSINAFSVLSRFLDLERIAILDKHHSWASSAPSTDTQTVAHCALSMARGQRLGAGMVWTDWTRADNSKRTIIAFGTSRVRLLLDHTLQQAALIDVNGVKTVLADFADTGERLLNHYRGVLRHFRAMMQSGLADLHTTRTILRLVRCEPETIGEQRVLPSPLVRSGQSVPVRPSSALFSFT